MSVQKDFDLVKDLCCSFFRKRSIIETLKIIDDQSISGWEKWMQIEFAKFCNDRKDVAEWYREEKYKLDMRMSKKRNTCSVDFLLRQKYKQTWVALELKQKNRASSCIKSMIRDLIKIGKIRSSDDDIRSVWCFGVHKTTDEKKVNGYVAKYGIEFEQAINESYLYTQRIGRSAYSFTLF